MLMALTDKYTASTLLTHDDLIAPFQSAACSSVYKPRFTNGFSTYWPFVSEIANILRHLQWYIFFGHGIGGEGGIGTISL